MKLSKLTCTLFLSLVSCTSVGIDSRSDPWKKRQVSLGRVELSFEVPSGAAADFPFYEGPASVSIGDEGVFNSLNQGPDLFRRYWSFNGGAFKQPDGLLLLAILLRRSDSPLLDETALEAAFVRNDDLFWRNQQVGAGGRGRLYFQSAMVAGRRGLLVRSTTSAPEYVVALDETHYIEVIIDASGQGAVRQSEDAIGERILTSLQITPKAGKTGSENKF